MSDTPTQPKPEVGDVVEMTDTGTTVPKALSMEEKITALFTQFGAVQGTIAMLAQLIVEKRNPRWIRMSDAAYNADEIVKLEFEPKDDDVVVDGAPANTEGAVHIYMNGHSDEFTHFIEPGKTLEWFQLFASAVTGPASGTPKKSSTLKA